MTTFFIGDVALDEYYTADRWPGRADKSMVRELPAEIGDSIANAAVVHAALGGETQFISLLNDSALSRRLIDDLRQNGVGVDHMLIDPAIADDVDLALAIHADRGRHLPHLQRWRIKEDLGHGPLEDLAVVERARSLGILKG